MYNQLEQYITANNIMNAVCAVGEVTFLDMTAPARKSTRLNMLRGLFCYITRDMCVHPDRAARMLGRTRQNVINQARKYGGYLQANDKWTTTLYNSIINELNKANEKTNL